MHLCCIWAHSSTCENENYRIVDIFYNWTEDNTRMKHNEVNSSIANIYSQPQQKKNQ